MSVAVLRPVSTAALTLLVGGMMLTPVASATTSQPPQAGHLLQASASAMKTSLHQVHAVGFDSVLTSNGVYRLRMSADCIMQSQALRGHFHVWGTRVAPRTSMRPEAYDKQFILFLSRSRSGLPQSASWERDALKNNAWRRNDSVGAAEAFQYIGLCVASPLFIDVLQSIPPKGLTNLGSTHTAGFTTWRLRSARSSGTGRASKTLYNDLYIDQATHYLVRMRLNNDDDRSYELRTFSKFNRPVTIQPPVVSTRER
jgi:hypothetical protein